MVELKFKTQCPPWHLFSPHHGPLMRGIITERPPKISRKQKANFQNFINISVTHNSFFVLAVLMLSVLSLSKLAVNQYVALLLTDSRGTRKFVTTRTENVVT